MIRKIIAVLLLSLSLTAFSGCSSFDDKPIKNAMDDYFNWFDSIFEDDSKNEDSSKNEENSDENDEEGGVDGEITVSLNAKHIIF